MAKLLQVLFLVLVLASCTHTQYKNITLELVENYPQKEKLGINVALQITELLKKTKWEEKEHSAEGAPIMPLGDVFVQNSELMSRKLFANVIVKDDTTSLQESGVDALLTPRMILVEQAIGYSAWGNLTITIMFEWSLKDLKDNVVWVDTIKGEATSKRGKQSESKKNNELRVKALIEDLFHKSYQAISLSPEIREFADTIKR
jgi:hypothetical protein